MGGELIEINDGGARLPWITIRRKLPIACVCIVFIRAADGFYWWVMYRGRKYGVIGTGSLRVYHHLPPITALTHIPLAFTSPFFMSILLFPPFFFGPLSSFSLFTILFVVSLSTFIASFSHLSSSFFYSLPLFVHLISCVPLFSPCLSSPFLSFPLLFFLISVFFCFIFSVCSSSPFHIYSSAFPLVCVVFSLTSFSIPSPIFSSLPFTAPLLFLMLLLPPHSNCHDSFRNFACCLHLCLPSFLPQ